VRRAFAFLAAAVAATGWSVALPAPVAAQCPLAVVRHDRPYFLYPAPKRPVFQAGASLAGTLMPGCSDVAGGPAPAPTRVKARSIVGVSPDVALVVRGHALVAMGYLPWLPGFPLGGHGVDETKGCRTGAADSVTGTTVFSLAGIRVATGGGPVDVLVDEHTRVAGLTSHGLPYIGDGQRVRVDAVHCGRSLLARRIMANGRIVPATTAEDILGDDWRGGSGTGSSAPQNGWWAGGAAALTAALLGGAIALRRRPGRQHRS
jgi:hypothetical protein